MLMSFVSMWPILPTAFVSLFILLLGNFFPICILLWRSWCLSLGRSLFLGWWYGCMPMRVMSLKGTYSFTSIVWGSLRTTATMSLSRGIRLLSKSLITPHLSKTGSWISFLSLEMVGSSSPVRTWPPSFFVVGEFPCLLHLLHLFSCFSFFQGVMMIDDLLVFLFYSYSASSSEEEVSTSCWKSKGIFGDR